MEENKINFSFVAILLSHTVDAQYGDLLHYSEVRWLSRGAVWNRFFELRKEIQVFMEQKDHSIVELLSNVDWLFDLAFLVDVCNHLNHLNAKLQGRKQLVTVMYDHVKAFQAKLRLWDRQLRSFNFSHFPTCKTIMGEHPEHNISGGRYASTLCTLQEEFKSRFVDFVTHSEDFQLFGNSFSVDVDNIAESMQMEVIELKHNNILKEKFKDVGVEHFYAYDPQDTFSKLCPHAAKMMSLFGSTYICEQSFSLMKANKTACRSRLTDTNLCAIMQLANTNLQPPFQQLVSQKRCQVSSS